ncbi:hypothetical protein VFPBJ_05382 [Purpureocillium lilacinum]|uniref:Uncharacterized protein n=1 Tax=Purpureocillium lilacinum TaxID=33203 RepID=A0A179GPE8_PURLI|nr:hypothetical protein VFPBJ_05382 [Purpureocillium lilacinum]
MRTICLRLKLSHVLTCHRRPCHLSPYLSRNKPQIRGSSWPTNHWRWHWGHCSWLSTSSHMMDCVLLLSARMLHVLVLRLGGKSLVMLEQGRYNCRNRAWYGL